MVFIDVIGFGLSESATPVFIICCQKDQFKDWTIYRDITQINSLYNELISHFPNISHVPKLDSEVFNRQNHISQ